MDMRLIYTVLFSLIAGLFTSPVFSQCPQLYDGQGNPSSNPYWISCTGGDYTLFIQSPNIIGPWTIDWGDGSPVSNGPNLIPPNFVSHTYLATVDTFIVTFTDLNNSCVITGVVVMEEAVNASIQIPVGISTQICAPDTLWVVNSSTKVSQTSHFTWDWGDGSPQDYFDYTNWQDTIFHVYQPNTVNCNTILTLYAENYCSQGNPTIATFNPIQVWDVDQAEICADNILLCYPDTIVHFDNCTQKNCSSQGNNSQRYEYWNFGDYWGLNYDSIIPWQPYDPPNRPGYDIAYPGIGTYSVMLIDSSYCGNDTAYLTITIVAPPVAAFSANDTICEGETVYFTDNSSGGANSWYWDFGDGNNSTQQNPTHVYNTPGDYTVVLIVGVTGGSPSCTDTATMLIHVLPSPVAGIIPPNASGCDSLTVLFLDASSNAVSWYWDFGNSNTSTLQNPPAQQYTAPGNYTVTQIVQHSNGCTDTAQMIVHVYESPVPDFQPFNVCEDEISYFFDLSTSSDSIISWYWDFGDGNNSNLQNPTNIYLNSGTYTVYLTVSTAYCTAIDSFIVTVEPKPSASFTPDTTEGCTPLLINFNNTSTGAVNYYWEFGDGNNSTQVNPSYTYVNNSDSDTSFIVMLVSSTTFGCSDTAYDTIVIHPAPKAIFSTNYTPDCGPVSVSFTDSSLNSVAWQWDFGDSTGSSLQNPTHIFQNQTLFIQIFTVTLIVTSTNGCTDTASMDITVYPEPQFSFSVQPDSGCSPLTVTFPAVIGAVQYYWDFGDGDTASGPTPTHTFIDTTTNNQTFIVTLIATSPFGCLDTSYGTVVVFPNPKADFSLDTLSGCSPLDVSLTNNSSGAVNYYWDFGDGDTSISNSQIINHSFSNTTGSPVNYIITLIGETTAGCRDTMTKQVLIYPKIEAVFTSDSFGCSPFTVNFTNLTQGAQTYNWDFGDGGIGIGTNPVHTYTDTNTLDTTFSVTMIATSQYGCKDTAYGQIKVVNVIAEFVGSGEGCAPYSVDFVNNSVNAGSFLWDFGDGGNSTEENPHYTYYVPGTYTVMLQAFCDQGQYDMAIHQNIIIVHENAIAFFGNAPSIVVIPNEKVEFYNFSEYSNNWKWDFGDGSVSSDEHPEHYYQNAGVYNVTLISNNQWNCPDTFSIFNAVIAEESGEIVFPNAFTPDPGGSNGGVYDHNAIDNNIFFPVNAGVTEYHLMIFNRWGELIFESFDVNIGWDGYYRGKLCQQDVYVWKVQGKFANNEEFVKAGDVTLLR